MFRICFHQKDEQSNEAAGKREKQNACEDREKKKADDRHQDLQVVLVAMTVVHCVVGLVRDKLQLREQSRDVSGTLRELRWRNRDAPITGLYEGEQFNNNQLCTT
ncbi:hypothetical protein G5714_013367 [Onychostoma macrolepis]|uniref:Uncharacterized protein n=1 Tax=Onychostoma macrolepis TaxID=369639 RepID=A0A7J6CGI1_9TELE|nr:hypothetical protein G5714_013367 [Onychostoma macrolepis]